MRNFEISTILVVSFRDMSSILNISMDSMMEILSDSDICFGTNDMTLVSVERFCSILKMDIPSEIPNGIMVNLEC